MSWCMSPVKQLQVYLCHKISSIALWHKEPTYNTCGQFYVLRHIVSSHDTLWRINRLICQACVWVSLGHQMVQRDHLRHKETIQTTDVDTSGEMMEMERTGTALSVVSTGHMTNHCLLYPHLTVVRSLGVRRGDRETTESHIVMVYEYICTPKLSMWVYGTYKTHWIYARSWYMWLT